MVIFADSAKRLKGYLGQCGIKDHDATMFMRLILAFIFHRGSMSCSAAAGAIGSDTVHRGNISRFLSQARHRKVDFNKPLIEQLLRKESKHGRFIFIVDATQKTQASKKVQNTYTCSASLPDKKKKASKTPAHKRRYNRAKAFPKSIHSFTFGLLITPSGLRIPFQRPYYTNTHCKEHSQKHRSTAQSAAEMILALPIPEGSDVIVLGDSAYDAQVVREACQRRGYKWIFPCNAERVYPGTRGKRKKLRSRLEDWNQLSVKRHRLQASTGKYANYRRLSKYRVGPKMKNQDFYVHQEKVEVHNVGYVQLVFSTMKKNLQNATPDDVKILMTNAVNMKVDEILELYSLRWQIELFFKELKSCLGFAQYSFKDFRAVETWVELAITTILFLEDLRATRMVDKRLDHQQRQWWARQRVHGLCHAVRQEFHIRELKFIESRLKTSRGISKLKRLILAAVPNEFRLST
jgi:hypothetical protein